MQLNTKFPFNDSPYLNGKLAEKYVPLITLDLVNRNNMHNLLELNVSVTGLWAANFSMCNNPPQNDLHLIWPRTVQTIIFFFQLFKSSKWLLEVHPYH
jgi:hypothetical protein